MNWGHGIALSLLAFVGLMTTMVVLSMAEKTELVANDYYKKELAHGEKIRKMKNSIEQNMKVKVGYNEDLNTIGFHFPVSRPNGKLVFFRPSDSDSDFELILETDSVGVMQLEATKMKRGMWKVSIEWKNMEDTEFLEEHHLYVP